MASEQADVIVIGSGGAGLVTACVAADAGLEVAVLERSGVFGGTTAISGGMLWVGNNGLSDAIGIPDSREETLAYLARVTRGEVEAELVEAFVDTGPELVRYLQRETPVQLFPIKRPDYHAHWDGGKPGGRVLDNRPFPTSGRAGLSDLIRHATHFPLLTYQERHEWRWPERFDWDLIAQRTQTGVRTLGEALVGGLLAAALDRGVRLVARVRALDLIMRDGRAAGVRCSSGEGSQVWRAGRAVVLASGGFEWNEQMRRSFLRGPAVAAVSPPWNLGDALRMAMRAGAALGNMAEAWWGPTFQIPGEQYDGFPMSRHMVDELSLPGSILVNRSGMRFINESMNYNDLSKLFHVFDPAAFDYVNTPAWIIFDSRFKSSYAVATVPSGEQAPPWFNATDTLAELAGTLGIHRSGLEDTIRAFNRAAREGRDRQFGRGEHALDRYYGDETHKPNPCLGPIDQPPFYAIEIVPGLLGTKGGARTDLDGRVLGYSGSPIPGLYACGNAAASAMGPGYPGAGGSLGPLLTQGLRCGRAISRD